MPAKFFKCLNGQEIEMKECFKGCPYGERCMPLPALMAVGKTRPFRGKASVTQLIKDTRSAYLEIVNDYSIDPQKSIASMIGTNAHAIMEHNTPNGYLAEVRLEDDITSGAFDYVDLKGKTLGDFKFYNSYVIAKKLGYRSRWKNNGVYQRGANKGKPKWEQVFEPGGVRDTLEVSIQMSYYKHLLKKHGITVDKLKLHMFIRGGLDRVAKSYGLDHMSYTITLNGISERWVRRYMEIKSKMLLDALESGICPPVCKDRWGSKSNPDLKCREYCGVNKFCDYYQEHYGNKQ